MINGSSFEGGIEIGVSSCVFICVINERLVKVFAIKGTFTSR